MLTKKITYKGKTYPSIKALVAECAPKDISYTVVVGRLYRGFSVKKALELPCIHKSKCRYASLGLKFEGVEYTSISHLYKAVEKHRMRYGHKKLNIDYGKFVDVIKTKGVEEAIKLATDKKYKKREIKGLARKSRVLKGADNLVCQRMTKLGWSYERAISTPKSTTHSPIRVKVNGVEYSSITKCYKALKPKMTYPAFQRKLESKGCIIK